MKFFKMILISNGFPLINIVDTQKKPGRPEANAKVKTPAKRRKKEIVPQTPTQHKNSAAADTSELTSSGRPQRRAAKVYGLLL